MAKLTDEELLARVEDELSSAQGNNDELSEVRRESLLRYYAEPYGNEIDSRSQVVDTTVMDTIGRDRQIHPRRSRRRSRRTAVNRLRQLHPHP